ncbi:FAD-dependent monooxygenase [Methylocystis sp. MJC1]|uniref:methanobactin biosynthesis FAD monooxygenase MbnF n=1 Tax=Methylocystis sp. MJC1 TaxID=2654282 RepID=UPI0013ECE5B3|nr:methanobactin biosynthesis FAD monooxygenase MbnF [Methylocystis sp. MJC1]KAF2988750.1 Aklavinone 12-hydroxylase RdmE [Methylocystis sp. MJC1]MBU6526831.1 FAD-dependent monooxygenase [Methylocystis sp. MJC1]UZX13266.1 FAD-dependent monooxygenase [Methylocystis sp. MJC1]
MAPRHVSVLIVGAGYAGLTAAAMLSLRRISCVLVEKNNFLSRHPRAHGLNLRTLELLRQIPGLEADLHRTSRAAPGDNTVLIAETVVGRPIKTIDWPGGFDTRSLSPASLCSAGQDRVEPVLMRYALSLGAEIRFSTELASFSQDDKVVRAVLRDAQSGNETVIFADYLIAGDGSGSSIRKTLGVAMEGPGVLSHAISILFEADLRKVMDGRGFLLCYIRNPEFNGAFVSCDDPDRGQLNVEYDPARESAADYDAARCERVVRAALGQPDLNIGILDVLPWKMSAVVAERMKIERVFLVGDSAHIMPPVGGLAGQAAIQDAADLAWKLSMVVGNQAGAALLDTYETERRPIAWLSIMRAKENYVERLRIDRSDLSEARGRLSYLEVAMSYRYRSAAISLEEPDDERLTDDVRSPSCKPGCRLAHVPLERKGELISTHDLVGDGFLVLAGPDGKMWVDAARAIAQRSLAPITAFRVDGDIFDVDNAFLARTGLGRDGALLVRPDGFVAWRSASSQIDAEGLMACAMARALFVPAERFLA